MSAVLTFLSVYKPVLTTNARYIILYGGRSAGRTYFAVSYFLYLIREPEYFRGYFMREVQSDIRESLYREFIDLITDLGIENEFQIIDNIMTIVCIETGNRIVSKGFKKSAGNQTAKLKSIAGATHVIIEEADEVTQTDFEKLDESLRTEKSEQLKILLLTNTEHPQHWIWHRFFRSGIPIQDERVLQIHATYRDNIRYTSSSTIQLFESYKEENRKVYDVRVLGKLAKEAEGQIYPDCKIIEEIPPDIANGFGLDFGYTNDPTALVRCAYHNRNLYIDEYIYQQGLTNPAIATKALELGLTRQDLIVADSAEPKSIAELQTAGLYVKPAVKGPGSLNTGIQMLQEMQIHITRRSKNIWEEQKFYVWKTDRDGKPTNVPVDNFNHAWDAARYCLTNMKLTPTLVYAF